MNNEQPAGQAPQDSKLIAFDQELKALCERYQYKLEPALDFHPIRGLRPVMSVTNVPPAPGGGIPLNPTQPAAPTAPTDPNAPTTPPTVPPAPSAPTQPVAPEVPQVPATPAPATPEEAAAQAAVDAAKKNDPNPSVNPDPNSLNAASQDPATNPEVPAS